LTQYDKKRLVITTNQSFLLTLKSNTMKNTTNVHPFLAFPRE